MFVCFVCKDFWCVRRWWYPVRCSRGTCTNAHLATPSGASKPFRTSFIFQKFIFKIEILISWTCLSVSVDVYCTFTEPLYSFEPFLFFLFFFLLLFSFFHFFFFGQGSVSPFFYNKNWTNEATSILTYYTQEYIRIDNVIYKFICIYLHSQTCGQTYVSREAGTDSWEGEYKHV